MIAQMRLSKRFKALNRLVFLRKDLLKGILIFLITFISVGCFNDHVQILENKSESMPHKVFLYFPKITPKKGDITVLKHEGKNLIKRIIGEQGDSIYYDANKNLYVGDFKVGLLQEKDSYGCPLYGIEEGTIPKGFVFLYAPHPRSFDSRYDLLGLVEKEDLRGRAIPLF
jgi:conjugal transfer pilin signal peptidase TrbI